MAGPHDPRRRKPLHPGQRQLAAAAADADAGDAVIETGGPDVDVERARFNHGWLTIAAKEFADHLLSIRFFVLLVILVVATAVPIYIASGRLTELASQVSGAPALFLALFTVGSADIPMLRVDAFVGYMAPLLGIAFGFDAVNGERSEGTLPRLLSQPIHRDDVINGKFAAGLALIALVLVAMTFLISGFGIIRLGIAPTGAEAFRIAVWLLVTIVYVGFWLAFGTLLSVVFRRAATAALVGFGTWLAVTIFGSLITTLLADFVAPLSARQTDAEVLSSIQRQEFIARLLPSTLYEEVTAVILNPSITTVSTPSTVGQLEQASQQVSTLMSLDQSVLLVWPQVVVIVALMVVLFALAYIAFMRQEVRA